MSSRLRLALIMPLALIAGSLSTPGWAYDLETHRAINDGAVIRSSLNDYLAGVLGLEGGTAAKFNEREAQDWIREGGAFEDDPVTRTPNHFHHPLRPWDQALLTDPPGSLFGVTSSSVLWAQNPNQNPGGTWSWVRARDEFLDALTLSDVTEREAAFAHTFRALGQVLHLVADASVPAHVRNDSHLVGEPIEIWLEGQARRRPGETLEQARARFLATFAPTSVPFSSAILGATPDPLAPIPIAKVFDTDAYDGTVGTLGFTAGNAVGISEFSNANFFSASTIFADRFGVTHRRFSPFPASTAVEEFIDPINNRRYWRKTSPGVAVEHLATVSRLDFFRRFLGGGPRRGGLDQVVHDEYARLLIPRAVAYSTGLIDYFFRGRLEAVDAAFTDTGVSLKVRNAIDTEKFPEWDNEVLEGDTGEFVLTAKYKQAGKEELDVSSPVAFTTTQRLIPGDASTDTSTETLNFTLPPLPDGATNVEHRLIWRGALGKEDDTIAVGIVEPASGLLVQPNYLPADGISGRRLIVRRGGRWELTPDPGLDARNIDWKGAYVRGVPTKVLTWRGPRTRYFRGAGTHFAPDIYQGGDLFAVAPRPVLGAAIAKDAQANEWLIAVCMNGGSDVVYRKPNKKDTSPALFDPITAPDGWKQIGSFPRQPGALGAEAPWFFNGDGTEAQTVRKSPRTIEERSLPNWLDRYKVTIVDASTATFENLGNEVVRVESTSRSFCATPSRLVIQGGLDASTRITGSHVIAVDYVDDQEILGFMKSSLTSSAHREYLYAGEHREVEIEKEESLHRSGHIFTWGANQVSLQNGATGERRAFLQRGNPAVGGLFHSGGTEERRLIYLDMRHDLVVFSEQTDTTIQDSGGIRPGDEPTPRISIIFGLRFDMTWTTRTSRAVKIWYRGEVHTLHSEEDSEVTTIASGVNLGKVNCGPGSIVLHDRTTSSSGVGTPSTVTVDQDYRVKLNYSSAVDTNGHLFISMEYFDGQGVRQVHNMLTEGDPRTVIPDGPQGARYFPVAVVK